MKFYSSVIDRNVTAAELRMQELKIGNENVQVKSILETLDMGSCDKYINPNIYFVLKIILHIASARAKIFQLEASKNVLAAFI